jgi:hypothetical protein
MCTERAATTTTDEAAPEAATTDGPPVSGSRLPSPPYRYLNNDRPWVRV